MIDEEITRILRLLENMYVDDGGRLLMTDHELIGRDSIGEVLGNRLSFLQSSLDNGLLHPIDANLEFIHVGDRLEEGTAKSLTLTEDGWHVVVENEGCCGFRYPSTLHLWHPRGKDGKVIKRWDTVYGGDGVEFKVTGVLKDKAHCIVGEMADGHCKFLKPEWLSHERPETVDEVIERALNKAAMLDREPGYWPSAADITNIVDEVADKLQLRED